jgi:hypothetical protein
MTIEKFKADYKIGGFYNLIEWLNSKTAIAYHINQEPEQHDYHVIIDDQNIFQPSIAKSMRQNGEELSQHLCNILRLNADSYENDYEISQLDNLYRANHEILDLAVQHDLPIFISIDGSLDDEGIATTSVSIISPDMKDTDDINSKAWQDRQAIILLICLWRLPKSWGTGQASINMAESIGFIIGEYTIPTDMPIIYITDSNNARTVQRNLKNIDDFTHRKKVRQVKQGINYAIANYLEYLTKKWP